MKVFGKLRARVRQESFCPRWIGLISNPTYILRRGLFRTIRELSPCIKGRVLDFGCGSKPYEKLFTGAQPYLGVDIAVSGHPHEDSKVDVFWDGKTLEFQDNSFDAVVSFEVFEHVFNLCEVLPEIRRVTKESGYLLISIPFAWEEHEIPYDFARYTSYGISHILKSHGYDLITIRKTTTYVLALWQMLIAYLMRIIPRNRAIRYLCRVCIIFPCTLAAYATDALLPRRYDYFCNTVVLARKLTVPSGDAAEVAGK
jgi:SAM-dependent methyltransferase